MAENKGYLNNPDLPTIHDTFEFTEEMAKEYVKCKSKITYFAENYFTITTLDHGKQKITLYRPQRRIIKSLGDYNRVVCLASRQTGKCAISTSKIKIRNKKTLEIEDITLGEFHNRTAKND